MSWGRLLVFLFIAGGVLGSVHYYFWTRLVRDAHLPAPASTVATWIIAALWLVMIVGMPASFVLPRRLAAPIAWVSYTWMGLVFFLFVLTLATDTIRVGLYFARHVADGALANPERRLLVQRILAAVVGVGALGFGTAGLVGGLEQVRVKKIRIALRRMRASRIGYSIVQLSDVHIGPTLGREFLADIVARTNALKPNLIVITGDLVDGTVDELRDAVAPLADLRAADGVYFVTGNHEYFSGVDEWLAYLTTLGIRVLRNERVSIGGSDGFDLAGVDDWTAARYGSGHGPDLSRALEGRDRSRGLILLAHQPKQVFEAADAGVDLQLSGHTHGGQMFPFGYLVKLQQPYVAGFHIHEGTALYVSRGTGYWGPPMRVGSPAEITHIELGAS